MGDESVNREVAGDGRITECRMRQAEEKVRYLEAVLRKYADCRHGQIECFCTFEARTALGELTSGTLKQRLEAAIRTFPDVHVYRTYMNEYALTYGFGEVSKQEVEDGIREGWLVDIGWAWELAPRTPGLG